MAVLAVGACTVAVDLGKIKAEIHAGIHFPKARMGELTVKVLLARRLDRARHRPAIKDNDSRLVLIVEFFGPDRPLEDGKQ